MKKVITYGTFDLLHRGHVRLLERARALGDYLVVGVTSTDYDRSRGKINVSQSLLERVDAVRATGLADEIVIEEYEGQKIDDIRRLGIDVFAVGSDWQGEFDFLQEWCDVVYLRRTEGISSSELRSDRQHVRLGILGDGPIAVKYASEVAGVNGLEVTAWCTDADLPTSYEGVRRFSLHDRDAMFESVDAVYVVTHPNRHYHDCEAALAAGRHVLCEAPIALMRKQGSELFSLADERGLVFTEAIKTAYSTAYERLLLLLKGGHIGEVVAVYSSCTSLSDELIRDDPSNAWNSICAWGPTAMLPVFQLLGCDWLDLHVASRFFDQSHHVDAFTKADFTFSNAVASCLVGKGVKSEGELVVSGTEGYAVVPAPWWKTEYFEIRREDQTQNTRHYYQLDGEGIRYALVSFLRSITTGSDASYVSRDVSLAICRAIEQFYAGVDAVL